MAVRAKQAAPVQTPATPPPSRRPGYHYQIEMEKSNGRKFPVFTMIVGVFVCFAMLSAVIYSNVQQLQINNQITAKQQELTDLQSENVRMQSEIAGKTSNKNIQEYAEDVLGMHIIDASQIEYVQIQTSDVVEIPEAEQNVFVKVKSWFDGLVEYLRG
ncbi:MAG: cell division protein FtsL [Oscillospiraceae bacterium]|jgi:cell division protein FtsL|nr:cell division protein FtsL [Oscillospiraceae bacterium]